MTIQELNDLIARGAAQPGVRDALELMRLGQDLDRQAREQLLHTQGNPVSPFDVVRRKYLGRVAACFPGLIFVIIVIVVCLAMWVLPL